MSWDSYIDTLIGHSKIKDVAQIDRAAIIGQNGALWTTHNHASSLKLSADEALVIGQTMQSGDFTQVKNDGLKAEGLKYMFLRGEEDVMCGKKIGEGAISCVPSSTAVVIAHCVEGGQQGQCNVAAGVIADYLKSLNM